MWVISLGATLRTSEARALSDDVFRQVPTGHRRLMRLSNMSGSLQMSEVTPAVRSAVSTNDVYILDDGLDVFVWIGRAADPAERKNGLKFGKQYLANSGLPADTPVLRIIEGGENEQFEQAFSRVSGLDDYGGGLLGEEPGEDEMYEDQDPTPHPQAGKPSYVARSRTAGGGWPRAGTGCRVCAGDATERAVQLQPAAEADS